jgi:hypothetical protein
MRIVERVMPTKIEEGEIFSVPLGDGRYAVGVAARRTPQKGRTWGICGYFFGPFVNDSNFETMSRRITSESARCVLRSGALHFHADKWKVVGRIDPWDRNAWLLPDFCRYERHTDRFFRVRYDENLTRVLSEVSIPDRGGLPEAVLYGAEAAEHRLTDLMSDLPALDRLS